MQDVIRDFLIWLAAFVTISATLLVLVSRFAQRHRDRRKIDQADDDHTEAPSERTESDDVGGR